MAALVEVGTRRRFKLSERTTIGRHPFSDVHLTDPAVAMSHAEIVRTAAGG